MSINFVLKPRWVLEPFLSYRCLNKVVTKTRREKEYEKWHFCYRTLLRLAVFCVVFGQLYERCWSQRHWKRKPGSFSIFVVKLYGFCLSIIYIARRHHPYIESLPALWCIQCPFWSFQLQAPKFSCAHNIIHSWWRYISVLQFNPLPEVSVTETCKNCIL